MEVACKLKFPSLYNFSPIVICMTTKKNDALFNSKHYVYCLYTLLEM